MTILDAAGDTAAAAKERGGEMKRKRLVEPSLAKWRTEGEEKAYASKLVEALRVVCGTSPAAATGKSRSRAVREASDRALAAAARCRTRWSRTLLYSRMLKLRPRARTRRPRPLASASRAGESGELPPGLESKTRVLGRLVPGCRKLPLPALLEEASDYIAALELQVRTMSVIANILSAASASPVATAERRGQLVHSRRQLVRPGASSLSTKSD